MRSNISDREKTPEPVRLRSSLRRPLAPIVYPTRCLRPSDYIVASDGHVDRVDCGGDLIGGTDYNEVDFDSSDDVSNNCECRI